MNRTRVWRNFLAILLVVALFTGCNAPAGTKNVILPGTGQEVSDSESSQENIPPEQLAPVKLATKRAISDLSKAFSILTEKGTRDFYEGYPVDMAFLHWVNNTYGDASIMDIAYRLYEGYIDTGLWYHNTGSTMHVLWLRYCRELQYSTYYLENVRWVDCKTDTVTIDFTGDINLADDWYTMEAAAAKPNGIKDCIAEEVTKELQEADLSVINHEFVLSDIGTALPGKAYTFRAKTSNVALLDVFGADVANLANNHIYDFGPEALMDTVHNLEAAGIETMGAGANIKEASAITYYVANGKKIAIVSATEIEKYSNYTKEATDTTAGVLKTITPTRYQAVIREAKANSDYVIANVHWGKEGNYLHNSTQTRLADAFVEAGADVIIGGHPHRLQGIEYIKDVPVLYSMGNFWFSTGTLYTMIAQIQIDEAGEIRVRTIPCIQQNLTTRMLTEEESVAFYKFMADISDGIIIDSEGYVHDGSKTEHEVLKTEGNYWSGNEYGSYNGSYDLEGRYMDIVGNLR